MKVQSEGSANAWHCDSDAKIYILGMVAVGAIAGTAFTVFGTKHDL